MKDGADQQRRLLLAGAIGGLTVMGGASVLSLATTLAPGADAIAKAGATVDLAEVPVGKFVTVTSGPSGHFVARRLEEHEFMAIENVQLDDLNDHHARNLNLPESALATSANRRVDQKGPFVIYSKICTVRGCILQTDEWDERHEWYCPCCGSRFDILGRATSYASRNLPIPRVVVEYSSVIRLLPIQLGRNPAIV